MRLNDFLPNYEDPVICTYDVNLLSANVAIDILRTHPIADNGGGDDSGMATTSVNPSV
jgi:hypothetical protein